MTRFISLFLMLAFFLPGTSDRARAAGTKTVTLEIPVFVGGYGIQFFQDAARRYEKLRPGVKINLYGDPRIAEKMRVRVIGGDFPDATDAALLWPNLIAAGKVLDLAPYLNGPDWKGDARWRDTFLPGVLNRWKFGKHIYGLPFAHAVINIFYNKALFKKHGWTVPRTWSELFKLCDKIKAAGIAPFSFPGVYLRYGDFFLRAAQYNLVGPEGYKRYNELAPGTRSDPRFIRAAGVLQTLSTKYFQKGYEGMTHTGAELAFFQGQAAMTVSGSWLVNEMKGKIPPGFALGAFNFPVFKDGITDPHDLQTGSSYYFIFAGGKHVRQTVDFFRFLTSRANAERFVRELNSPVAIAGVPASAWSPEMRDTERMIDASKASYGYPPESVAFTALVEQAMTDARQKLMSGEITPKEFGDRLESAAASLRDRMKHPNAVQMRHPLAGGVLLGILVLILAGSVLLWLVRRGRVVGPDSSGWLGPLRWRMAVVFVFPAFALYAFFILWPGLRSFAWSLTRWDGLGPRHWVGTFNFRWLFFESDVFWQAFRNNLFIMIVPTLVVVPLALLLAALLHRGVFGSRFFRACILFPNLLGGVAAALLWLNAYDPSGGLVNATLVGFGRLISFGGHWFLSDWFQSFDHYAWLAQNRLYWALIPIYVWMMVGFNVVLYLAAMEGIDPQYYEAAEIDGASPLAQFFRITVPLIWEVLAVSAVFIVIGGLNTFEMIWLLTAQEPSTGSHVLSTWMVSTLFRQFEIGRATAIAVVMFVIVLAGTTLVLKMFRREAVEH